MIFTCQEILFFCFFPQPHKQVKTFLARGPYQNRCLAGFGPLTVPCWIHPVLEPEDLANKPDKNSCPHGASRENTLNKIKAKHTYNLVISANGKNKGEQGKSI